jgi:hypothetical protein
VRKIGPSEKAAMIHGELGVIMVLRNVLCQPVGVIAEQDQPGWVFYMVRDKENESVLVCFSVHQGFLLTQ